jgi:hypothetical protein
LIYLDTESIEVEILVNRLVLLMKGRGTIPALSPGTGVGSAVESIIWLIIFLTFVTEN